MKRILMVFVVGFGLVACGDNSGSSTESGSEGEMLDSNVTVPGNSPGSGATLQPDTAISDTGTGGVNGNSSGIEGKSTNSGSSGSAKDDNKGTN